MIFFSIYTAITNRKWFSIICNGFESSKLASNISRIGGENVGSVLELASPWKGHFGGPPSIRQRHSNFDPIDLGDGSNGPFWPKYLESE